MIALTVVLPTRAVTPTTSPLARVAVFVVLSYVNEELPPNVELSLNTTAVFGPPGAAAAAKRPEELAVIPVLGLTLMPVAVRIRPLATTAHVPVAFAEIPLFGLTLIP